MDEDLYYEKELLKSYESQIKSIKKSIKWEKAYIGLCMFNVISFLINAIKHFNDKWWLFLLLFISSLIWVIIIIFTYKSIKIKKNTLTGYLQLHDKQLQVVDYPKYLKTQRTLKLNKIKKSLFS